MAQIIPFRAFRYDPEHVSVDQAVTQPYDKITPSMQDRYYAASPYNLVRIILGRRQASDHPANDVYRRAAADFRAWRSQGALRQDSAPSLYVYSQNFAAPGQSGERERRGFIALGRVEDYSAGVVYRHEQTLAKPKADRLDLLRATRAHFGQIFMLYEDSGEIDSELTAATKTAPIIELTDEYQVVNRVWQVSDPAVVASVQRRMRDKKLIIADGHHRYETALNYRNERRAADASAPDAPYEFLMMTLVNMNSPGLVVLPTHRVVRGLESFVVDDFQHASREFFEVEEVDPSLDGQRAAAVLRDKGKSGATLLAVTANRAFLLSKLRLTGAAARFFAGFSSQQRELDVVQLHKCLLEGVLKLSEESIREQRNLSYVRDADEALGQVRSGKADLACLMNPCRVQQVRDVAFAGEVMPQKSTDFYPKLLSGLTIYALD
ncbi:MAG TPA: DUF1015 domain-containing protein [Candidatus Sulfotelmatobacter sp.]